MSTTIAHTPTYTGQDSEKLDSRRLNDQASVSPQSAILGICRGEAKPNGIAKAFTVLPGTQIKRYAIPHEVDEHCPVILYMYETPIRTMFRAYFGI